MDGTTLRQPLRRAAFPPTALARAAPQLLAVRSRAARALERASCQSRRPHSGSRIAFLVVRSEGLGYRLPLVPSPSQRGAPQKPGPVVNADPAALRITCRSTAVFAAV